MKLSKRLEAIVSFVNKNSIVADIGTDHGYIPAYLVKNNISKFVIGTDISPGSLEKIIDFIAINKLEGKVQARLGDGLKVIKPFEVDTVIIAGMGGLLIQDILEKNKEVANSISNFIFQPMIASDELRRYLLNNNYKIIDEELVREDNKFYEIIYAKIGLGHIDKEINYEINNILIEKKHRLLQPFINEKIKKTNFILEELKDKESEKSKIRYNELLHKIKEYKEVLEEIES